MYAAEGVFPVYDLTVPFRMDPLYSAISTGGVFCATVIGTVLFRYHSVFAVTEYFPGFSTRMLKNPSESVVDDCISPVAAMMEDVAPSISVLLSKIAPTR